MNCSIEFPKDWNNPTTPGFGTYPGPYDYLNLERYYDVVKSGLRAGYKHIDHAQTYYNDRFVGKALMEYGNRNELFITSKLFPESNSTDGALVELKQLLENLGLSYLNMYLIHFPGNGDPCGAWKGFIKCRDLNLCVHIGVSNFEKEHLEHLFNITGQYPEVNQIEFHPLLYNNELERLINFCKDNNIALEGYCPLAQHNENLMKSENITSIASRHHKTRSQIVLKWSMQHGVRPIVGSRNSNHIDDNYGPYDFALSEEEMFQIDTLGTSMRLSRLWGWDPTEVKLEC